MGAFSKVFPLEQFVRRDVKIPVISQPTAFLANMAAQLQAEEIFFGDGLPFPETNGKVAPEKIDGWNTIHFLLGLAYFQGQSSPSISGT